MGLQKGAMKYRAFLQSRKDLWLTCQVGTLN